MAGQGRVSSILPVITPGIVFPVRSKQYLLQARLYAKIPVIPRQGLDTNQISLLLRKKG
jgi:hypothetical protein